MGAICGVWSHEPDRYLNRVERSLKAMGEGRHGQPEIWHDREIVFAAVGDCFNRNPYHPPNNGHPWHIVFDGYYDSRNTRDELDDHNRGWMDSFVDMLESSHDSNPAGIGGYALAAWNAQKRCLVLGRDRFGLKSLYHVSNGDDFLFASEVRGLLCLLDNQPPIDPHAIDCFLTYGYVPTPMTMFSGMASVKPNMALTVISGVPQDAKPMVPDHQITVPRDYRGRCKMLRALIEESVSRNVSLFRNTGFLLSGGVDTAVVAAIASRVADQKPRTFTMGFHGCSAIDERTAARNTAKSLNTDHTELEINEDCIERLSDITRRTGAPVGNPAALLCDVLYQSLSDHIDQVVTGDGGNEIFGATYKYNQVVSGLTMGRAALLRRAVKAVGVAAWRRVEDTRFDVLFQKLARQYFRTTQTAIEGPLTEDQNRLAADLYITQISLWQKKARNRLYTPEFMESLGSISAEDIIRDRFTYDDESNPVLQQLVKVRVNTFIPDEVMPYAERQASAHGLRTICPILDPELVDTMCSYPWNEVYGRGWRHIMREALAEEYGLQDVFDASHKGFKPPLYEWLHTPRWREILDDYLSPELIQNHGIFRMEVIEALRAGLASGKRTFGESINGRPQSVYDSVWTIVALEDWMRSFT